jgi:membrane protease YdiL (CAAX protease family)
MYSDVIRGYDSLLLREGDIPGILLEKCKFIGEAFYDAEEEANPKEEDWTACYEKLNRLYPDDARVADYRLSRLYGDSAIAQGKRILERIAAGRMQRADDGIMAGLHRKLGYAYAGQDSARRALSEFQLAIRYGDTTDLRLETARQWSALGQRTRAREDLLRPGKPMEGWEGNQAGDLLVRMGFPRDAIGYYRISIDDSLQADPAGMAKAMELAGEVDSARVYQARAHQRSFGRNLAERRSFEFALRHADGREALRAYREFRDQGAGVDPFSFYRLKLCFKHPWLPWAAREAAGLGLALLALAGLCLVPYLWVLPLHYLGRWWAGLRMGPRESPYGLRHAWLCSAGLLVAWFLAAGFFQHAQLSAILDLTVWGEQADISDSQKAGYLACFMGLGFAFALAFLRRTRTFALLRTEETLGRSLGYLLFCLVVIFAVRRLNLAVFPEDPGEMQREILEGALGGSLVSDLKACLGVWGLWPTILLVAVLVPFYEEVVFRGVLLASAGKYLPFWFANVLQAAAFASVHEGWARFPTFFAMALAFGWVARRTGGLLVPMLAHGINNLVAVTVLWGMVRNLIR